MGPLDAERSHGIWQLLVADHALLDAVLAGDVDRAAATLDLDRARPGDPADRAILEAFAASPDALRWNVTNLRYRASLETVLKLRRWMPLTTSVLTEGRTGWLMDLSSEYLAHHRWAELGHRHFAECLRFADFVRLRVAERRALPDHLETVLQYEAAICEMLARTAGEPGRAGSGDAGPEEDALGLVAAGCPRPASTTVVIELAEDIRPWILAGRPTAEAPRPERVTLLAFVPRRDETFWVTELDSDQRSILDRCTAEATGQTIADAAASDRRLRADDVLTLLAAWLREGALSLG